jgi:hypothetical protein
LKKAFKNLLLCTVAMFSICSFVTLKASAATSEVQSNDTMDTATNIAVNNTYTGNISEGGDVDFYKVSLTSDGVVNLKLNHAEIPGDSKTYWKAELLNSAGDQYMYLESHGYDTEKSTNRALRKGTYYVKIYRGTGYFYDYTTADYKLSVNFKGSNYYEKEFNDTMSAANEAVLNNSYTGNIYYGGDMDYYRVNLLNDDTINVILSHKKILGNTLNYWNVTIWDTYNNKYLHFNIDGTTDSADKSINLKKGTYYVRVCRGTSYYYDYSTVNYSVSTNILKGWVQIASGQ